MGRTPQESIGGVLISLSRLWACTWINRLSLWRTASAMPDLQLFTPHLQGITAPRPVPNYSAWWQRHVCVKNLPRVVTWMWNGRESNPQQKKILWVVFVGWHQCSVFSKVVWVLRRAFGLFKPAKCSIGGIRPSLEILWKPVICVFPVLI